MRWTRIVAMVFGMVLAAGVGASAHVTVVTTANVRGKPAMLLFRVPNERAHALTTKVEVQFPQTHPIAAVTVPRVAGWRHRVRVLDGIVDTITWTSGAIRPGQSFTFAVRVRRLPTSGTTLYFKALQTYSDGDVVRWIQIRNPGEAEPPNPAPMLRLVG